MICLTLFLYWERTGKILLCDDCPMFEHCMNEAEKAEEDNEADRSNR